ncbi:MAG TPA: UDP-N-acetylmuramoyl-L-alanyl-D-glutamate--2,6-diaminopimelate ligase, partial [Gammaproteobacteria bacterium]|nr:UDP-N-acetylmuramoyl-L-alanyl-D-glutamate--2,6-diaminopimelate ligase [Gammaproteobacteria bacterium]
AIETLDAVPGRMQRIDSEADEPLIIIDFAHTPDALEKVLISLRMHIEGKLICVFGCGGDRDWRKRPFMGEIVERYADMHIITNDNPRSEDPQEIVQQIRAGLKTPRRMPVILDREEAIRAALDVATKGDCVLIAGKGHEDYQLIGDQRLSFSDQKVVEQLLREQRGQA